jgi:hypothetical protein
MRDGPFTTGRDIPKDSSWESRFDSAKRTQNDRQMLTRVVSARRPRPWTPLLRNEPKLPNKRSLKLSQLATLNLGNGLAKRTQRYSQMYITDFQRTTLNHLETTLRNEPSATHKCSQPGSHIRLLLVRNHFDETKPLRDTTVRPIV